MSGPSLVSLVNSLETVGYQARSHREAWKAECMEEDSHEEKQESRGGPGSRVGPNSR